MKTNKPIKSFIAVTYNNKPYHFIITDDNKIYCCEFLIEYGADIIELKPNFVLRNREYQTIYSLKDYLREVPKQSKKQEKQNPIFGNTTKEEVNKTQEDLIQHYIIEPSVFEYLLENNMLMYSHDMALLYGFNPIYAYDKIFQKRSFKKSRHKENVKILSKQKKGIFR